MKILFNTTTVRKGGVLQRAVGQTDQLLRDVGEHEWCIATSPAIRDELIRLGTPHLDQLRVFIHSPARSWSARRRLADLERQFHPDCVFTLGGPAYVRFRAPHLLMCTTAWVSHPSWLAYQTKSVPVGCLTAALVNAYKGWWFREATAWAVQTETARLGLHRRLGLPLDHIGVIPNTCGKHYLIHSETTPSPPTSGKVRVLVFAAPYSHKRLTLTPDIAYHLRDLLPQRTVEFVLTLPPQHEIARAIERRARRLGVTDCIINQGPVAIADGPELYESCHISLLPTVFETFSATYVESMAMGLPIVTTDLGFARDVCQDAALYFAPNNPVAAAQHLARLLQDSAQWEKLAAAGKARLRHFPSRPAQRRLYMAMLTAAAEHKPISQLVADLPISSGLAAAEVDAITDHADKNPNDATGRRSVRDIDE